MVAFTVNIDGEFGFILTCLFLSVSLGHDPKPYNKQLSELRYSGVKTDAAPSLLEVVR